MARPKTNFPTVADNSASVRLEPSASTILQWNPQKLVLARQRAAAGDFGLFADLCEAMMPDDRVSKCLETLYSATTLPLTFLLPGKDSKQSANDLAVQALDTDWWKILPEQKLRTIVSWLGLANAALVHVDGWELSKDTGRRLPVVSVWSLRHLRSDRQKGFVVRVSRSTTDPWGTEEPIDPGDGNWVLLLSGSSWKCVSQARGHGVALFWLLKQYAIVDWAMSSERHGGGVGVVSCDKEAGSSKKERDELTRLMAGMARNANITLPPGWKFELVTDEANSYQTFQAQIVAADSATTIGIVGTNLTTEVKGGSRAAATVHESVDAARMRGMLELLATGFHDQLLIYWAPYNNATWVAPYPQWDTTPPADKKADAEAKKADAESLLTYRKAGVQLNQKAWFEGRVELLASASEEFPELKTSASDGALTGSQPKTSKVSLTGHRHAAKADPDLAFQRGLDYTGRVDESLRGHAAKLLAPDLASVLAAIESAESFSEAKALIEQAYRDQVPPTQLCRLTEAALLMTQLAGVESVEQELYEA